MYEMSSAPLTAEQAERNVDCDSANDEPNREEPVMAEMSQSQIRSAVERATAEVLAEVQGNEGAGFKVSDLRSQLDEFSGGKFVGDNAWTISYSTAAAAIEKLGDGGDNAWTISYSTSAAADIKEQVASPARRASKA